MVRFPTRCDKLLDLIFSNDENFIDNLEPKKNVTENKPKLSDHVMIIGDVKFVTRVNCSKSASTRQNAKASGFSRYNYFKCGEEDWKRLRDVLHDVEWKLTNDPEQDLMNFYSVMLEASSQAKIPIHVAGLKKKKSRLRRVHFRRIAKLQDRIDEESVNKRAEAMKKLADLYDEEKNEEETDATNKIKTNPKYFFHFVKSHCSQQEEVGDLLDTGTGNLVDDDYVKANLLQEQYSSVFSTPFTERQIPKPRQETESELSDFCFEEDDIV